jgi:hypothetical protein
MPDLITLATAVPPPDCFAPKGVEADGAAVLIAALVVVAAFVLYAALTCSGARRRYAILRAKLSARIGTIIDRSFEAR